CVARGVIASRACSIAKHVRGPVRYGVVDFLSLVAEGRRGDYGDRRGKVTTPPRCRHAAAGSSLQVLTWRRWTVYLSIVVATVVFRQPEGGSCQAQVAPSSTR